MVSTNVRHHYREGGKVSVTEHTRKLENRPEREKFEKPTWAKNMSKQQYEETLEYNRLMNKKMKLRPIIEKTIRKYNNGEELNKEEIRINTIRLYAGNKTYPTLEEWDELRDELKKEGIKTTKEEVEIILGQI